MTTYTCPDGHASTSGDYCDVCGSPIAGAGGSPSTVAATGSTFSTGSSLDLDAPTAAATTASQACPNCAADNAYDALFCEDCGYDFTTGQMPRPLAPPTGTVPSPGSTPGSPSGGAPSGSVATQATAAQHTGPTEPTPSGLPPSAQPTAKVDWVVEIWVDPDWYAAQDLDEPCPSAGMPLVVPVHQRSVLIGRHSRARSISPGVEVPGDNGVSRRHAQLSTDGHRWWLEDLQSSNGTFVGALGQPLPTSAITGRVELKDDERIYLGGWTRLVIRKATAADTVAP